MDDNINGFMRLNRNKRIKVKSDATIRAVENFVDRYENVQMAGMNYVYFAPELMVKTPYTLNTRIYSCILLDNSIKHRWRGKYNEDTDLSLRILKDGYCTILFNTFLADKITTQVMTGGNTEEVYRDSTSNRREFADSLKAQHPDCVEVVWRYERWHHEVDYRRFKMNKLKRIPSWDFKDHTDEYNMVLCFMKGNKKNYFKLEPEDFKKAVKLKHYTQDVGNENLHIK